ncbi:MAG: hypothetical protein ACFFG0_35230 [Candidatus Thorarchaeota archaeon]
MGNYFWMTVGLVIVVVLWILISILEFLEEGTGKKVTKRRK